VKKSFVKKLKRNRGVIALALCAVLVLGAVVGILLALRSCGAEPPVTDPEATTTADSSTGETTAPPVSRTEPASETAASTEPGNTSSEQTGASTEPSSETATSDGTSAATSDTAATTSATTAQTTPPPVTVVSMANADTERWLAAAAVVGVSMEYPDFELRGIYLASATSLENRADSKGAVIVFASGGEEKAIHAVPVSAERNTAGTRDISSEVVGFATFDEVSAASVDVSAMTEVDVDELGELIGQSLLISVYTH